MFFITDLCIGCKGCARICPIKCIDFKVRPLLIDQSQCNQCGRCARICPRRAIQYVEK